MERFKHIQTAPISFPAVFFYICLIAGVVSIGYAFLRLGLIPGVAIAIIPAALCLLIITIKYPVVSLFLLFVANYFIMGLTKYLPDAPIGAILDILVGYAILMLCLEAVIQRIEWRRAATGLTLVAVIWTIYCTLQLFNPESMSIGGWISAFRSLALNFLLLTVLTQLMMTRFQYLKYILYIWSVLTLLAVGKACIQKFIGFNATEMYWLYVLGGRSTHIIHSGVRYFSFFTDAANFGANMGLSLVVFSISASFFNNKALKLYLLFVAAAACYGMLISGTRSALAVPFVGYTVFVVLSRNWRIILVGFFCIISIFSVLKFTNIGQSNALVRRTRSAFDMKDPSFQVRLENQAKLRTLMSDKYFGVGLGHGGGKALQYAPYSEVAKIPTDSWFVMIWVETGVVGILLHLSILAYILLHGGWLVMFRLQNIQVKGLTTALLAGMAGVIVMSYASEVFGQIPTGALMYMSAAFIFLSPRFDKEMLESQTLNTR